MNKYKSTCPMNEQADFLSFFSDKATRYNLSGYWDNSINSTSLNQ